MSDSSSISPRVSPNAEKLAQAQAVLGELFPHDFLPLVEFKAKNLGKIDGTDDLVAIITLPSHLSDNAADEASECLVQALGVTTFNPLAPDGYNAHEINFFHGEALIPAIISLQEQKFKYDNLKRSLATIFDEERGHRIGKEGGSFLC